MNAKNLDNQTYTFDRIFITLFEKIFALFLEDRSNKFCALEMCIFVEGLLYLKKKGLSLNEKSYITWLIVHLQLVAKFVLERHLTFKGSLIHDI